MDIEFVGNKW